MLTEQERTWIEGHFTKLRDQQIKILVEIAKLKVKSGIWGIIGGAIPIIVYLLIKRL